MAQQLSDALRVSAERLTEIMTAMKALRGEYTSVLTRLSAARDVRKAKTVTDRITDMPEKNNATE